MNETNFEVPVEGPLFPFGKIAITAAAMQSLSPSDVFDGLTRHGFGDWGTVCMEDWKSNDEAMYEDGRLLSTYRAKDQTVFWIITEWNRTATTILLPSDY